MNNKLIARIVASVMAVAMLGTVSFATTIDSDQTAIEPGATIEGTDYTAQTTKTFMAFATNDKNATVPADGDVIIALDEVANITSPIAIDKSKIGENQYVVAIYSGNEEVKVKSTIDVSNIERTFELDTDIQNTVSGNENTYINVAYAEYEFATRADSAMTKVGIRFTKDDKHADVSVNDTEFSGGGNVRYAAVLYAVPSGEFEGMVAVPFVEYADYVD